LRQRRPIDREENVILSEFVAACVQEAANQFLVTPASVLGRSRSKGVAAARAMAMALVRRRTRLSYPELGRVFGRDHTTVMVAVKKAEREMPERLNWTPPVAEPRPIVATRALDGETLEQWEDRMGWSREAAAE
jgi:hypothetical protein